MSPRIKDVLESALQKTASKPDFLKITEIDEETLESILTGTGENYIDLGSLTKACQINKSHGDPDVSHSSISECIKGATIRIPQQLDMVQKPSRATSGRRLRLSPKTSVKPRPFYERGSMRLLGFSANTLTFILLGYFAGGLLLSPLTGQPSCTGVSLNPVAVTPCIGSVIGIVLGAVAGLGYTYYYFVKKM